MRPNRAASMTAPTPRGAVAGLALALCLLPVLGGCGLVKLRQEFNALYASTVLVGRIDCPAAWRGPVVVAAYARTGGAIAVAHRTLLHECGGWELIVPRGEYALFAFGDANRNFAWDAGEPAGEYAGAGAVAAAGTGVVAGLDFAIEADPARPPAIAEGTSFDTADAPRHSVQAGALADLDEAAFAAASGEHGYWAPVQAFRQGSGNIHFLEPYDPAKIPILFVHGAAGSPQDWRYFFEHIDRSRYQPWFFRYPSGAAIDSMAHLLYWKLLNLQLRWRFETLVIAAHSMGGLVVRDFLLGFGAQFPQIRLFVSLSTPWGGEAAAALGVRHSPAVVPSWIDMQPAGRFLEALFARPLPPHTAHYLFFGHKGGYSLLRPNHDGTVTLASQLHRQAQAEAKMVVGFDEDHDGILRSPEVLRQFQAVVDGVAGAGTAAPRAGQLELDFAFAGDAVPGVLPVLLLVPADADAAADAPAPAGLAITLSAGDAGRRIGPIPPGTYDASLVAPAFRSEPARQRIVVAAGRSPALHLRLVPQGTLSGYVGAPRADADNPAGSPHPPHAGVKITRITLAGAGQVRSLVPRTAGRPDLLAHYLDGQDDAYQAQFSFVGLPAGDYELGIEAEGHRPHRSRHTVVPGRPGPLRPIVLQPLPAAP